MTRKRGLLAIAGLVVFGIAAGTVYERWIAGESERIDVYFDDGSFVTYIEGSVAAERLLPLAREVLAAVRA